MDSEKISNILIKIKEIQAKYEEMMGDVDDKIKEADELLKEINNMKEATMNGEVYVFPEGSPWEGHSNRFLIKEYEKLTKKIEAQREKAENWLETKMSAAQDAMGKADSKIKDFQEKYQEVQNNMNMEFLKQKLEDKAKAKANSMNA